MQSIAASGVVRSSAALSLSPSLGTRFTGEGVVTFRDVTRYRLHRMKVEVAGKYPSLSVWCTAIRGRILTHYFEEKGIKEFTGVLWLFWKE
jgi:hypothetical protein